MPLDPYTINFIKQQEGFRPNVYEDYKQNSIGYGTRAQPGETVIDRATAEQRLRNEAGNVANFIDQNLPGIDPRKRSALISFGYNLGTGKGGLTDLLPYAKAGDWNSVSQKMQRYINAGGKPDEGLIKRRGLEASLITGNTMPTVQQLQAQTLRDKQPQVIQQVAPDAPSPYDSLITAVSGQRSPQSRLQDANRLLASGDRAAQNIASPWALAGALSQQGMGQYMKNRAQQEIEAKDRATMQNLLSQKDPTGVARTLIESDNPQYKAAGMQMLVKAMMPKSPIAVSPGATLFDPTSQKAIYTAPTAGGKMPKVVSVPSGIDQFGRKMQPKNYVVDPTTNNLVPIEDYIKSRLPQAVDMVPTEEGGTRYTGPITSTEEINLDASKEQESNFVTGPFAGKDRVGQDNLQKTDEQGRYLWQEVAGGLEPVIISKKAEEVRIKKAEEQPKAQARAAEAVTSAQNAIDAAETLRFHPGMKRAVGPVAQYFPTTTKQTANFETELENLKTKVFINTINKMRELSKTGGAVGQVTEREMAKLENSMRNLSLVQSEDSMKRNLILLQKDFKDSISKIKDSYRAEYGSELNINTGSETDLPRITTQAEYDKLPPGSSYIAPNGAEMRKK